MRIDRRGFFRILGAAVASVSGTASAARDAKGSVEIHQETRNTRFGALGPRRPELQSVPLPFKPYPEAERVELPDPVFEPMLPLAEAAARYMAGKPFFTVSGQQNLGDSFFDRGNKVIAQIFQAFLFPGQGLQCKLGGLS